jgi:uncharacterized SAM-dependent methyltransferase
MMSKCYAFDFDETLEASGGPVTLKSLMDLRIEGHIVGLCGNWGGFVQRVPGWQHLISFFASDCGYLIPDFKAAYLRRLKQYVTADDYIMVGNELGVTGASDDKGSAERAGWRFIREDAFAAGER